MRIKLNLTRKGRGRMIPMDYQYYISAWVYKVLKNADKDFATFLHNEGYGQSSNQLYKLFCFSRLNFGKPILWKEKHLFEIRNNVIFLEFSFDVQEAASNFIKGLFIEQEFYLGDKFNGIEFTVSGVEVLPEPEFSEIMHYRLQSPWVVSIRPEGSARPQYLKPEDENFNSKCIKHIVEKYNNIHQGNINVEDVTLTISSPSKRAGFVMKPGTKQQSKVVGNIFDFDLTAPIAIHQMIWNAGVSEKSSSGFGWVVVNVIDND